jgi:aminoglycoside phosphotransferase (APT) family kinase protein
MSAEGRSDATDAQLRPNVRSGHLGIARLLVETQVRLHALDPDVLLDALDRDVPGSSALVTLDGHLEQLETRITRHALGGLGPAMRWLRDHRPRSGGARAICHGDFHPLNSGYGRVFGRVRPSRGKRYRGSC